MEKEKSESKSQDETGYSEKELDKGVEARTFRQQKIKKILLRKKKPGS